VETDLQYAADAPFREYKTKLEKSRSDVNAVLEQVRLPISYDLKCSHFRKVLKIHIGLTMFMFQVESGLYHLQQLGEQHTFVSTKSNSLHTACQHLLEEQESLSALSEQVGDKYFSLTFKYVMVNYVFFCVDFML